MSAVRATETQEASEISRRMWRMLSWLLLVAILASGAIWWVREGRNLFWQPKTSDEEFLSRLKTLSCAQGGVASDFRFEGRITLAFQVSLQLSVQDQADQQRIREAIYELVAAFSSHRPNEEVEVKGYQGQEQVAEGRLRLKEYIPGKSLPVWVHIEGEKMGPEEHRPFE